MKPITLQILTDDFHECHIGRYGQVLVNAVRRQEGLTARVVDDTVELADGRVYTHSYHLRQYIADRRASLSAPLLEVIHTITLKPKP